MTVSIARKDSPKEPEKPWVETPLKYSPGLSRAAGCQIYLKLENLQPSGSFKSRGVGNYLASQLNRSEDGKDSSQDHFFIASGGNAGLACVTAAVSLNTPATVVVPLTTTSSMIQKIRQAGAAEVIQTGDSLADADAYMREIIFPEARAQGLTPIYVTPFDAPEVWTGNSTLVGEAVAQLGEQPDAFVCSVGGGGLFCGIMEGLDRLGMPDVPVLAVETHGAHSLDYSLERGEVSTMPAIKSIATSLGVRTVGRRTFEYAQEENVRTLVLQDQDARLGCVKLADEENLLVEAACGVSIATCYNGWLKSKLPSLNKDSKVIVVCCGGVNITIDLLYKYRDSIEQDATK